MSIERDSGKVFETFVHRYLLDDGAWKAEAIDNIPGLTKRINLIQGDRSIVIVVPSNYHEPDEINIAFLDKDQKKGYIIYITEVNDEVLEHIFNNIRDLIRSYFNSDYRAIKKKNFFSNAEYLDFNLPGASYSSAVLVKKAYEKYSRV